MRASPLASLSFAILACSTSSYAAELYPRDLLPPTQNLNNSWSYRGCYVDIGRTINAASTTNDEMTNEECMAFCFDGGFRFAGTEYYSECFCGQRLAAGAVKVDASECSTPCRGDDEQPCGGPSRLTLYNTTGPVQNPGIGKWQAQGCYVEGNGGRALSYQLGSVPANEMTVTKCLTACTSSNYLYAGVEYGGECYCGNEIQNQSDFIDDDSCDMTCYGNKTELCGGPNRLNMYEFQLFEEPSTTLPTVTETSSLPTTSSEVSTTESTTTSAIDTTSSAVVETTSTTAEETPKTTTSSEVETSTTSVETTTTSEAETISTTSSEVETTTSSAVETTTSSEAATTTSSEVETTTSSEVEITTSSEIDTTTSSEIETTTSSEIDTTTSSAIESTTTTEEDETSTTTSDTVLATETEACPGHPKSVGSWNWYGCYTEATNNRALNAKAFAGDTVDLESCAAFCAGYDFFGTEYAGECYCGNTFNAGSVKTDVSECNMICKADACEYCGAGNRLSVYTIGDGPVVDPSDTATNTAPSSTTTGAAEPTATGLPDGWSSYGCWVDGVDGRILGHQVPDDPQLTLASCAQACDDLGYTVAGAEYHTQCFCGAAIVNDGKKADSAADCNTACGGNSAENCGGPNRMSIFSIGEPAVFGPPAPLPNVGDWVYQGCAEDNLDEKRTFFWKLVFENQTPKQCLEKCGDYGYMAAGLEYGVECYCGDPANIGTSGAKFVDESQCDITCAGNSSAICGGNNRLSTYFWEGEPFYSWEFPEAGTAAAGSYEYLVGGVCIPLMTQQGINGKVTFVEKWGTGPANSSGAYELDLSLVSQPGKMWREMHLKTDVFCAAGVTLPDKAGRQLTVGGWSGDSTFGVRLYTPDGSPGVNGVNDWEENVDVLKLQDGRWYPSTMNMANGSILVVGGEEGSNGAPVPTLEILPYTGGAPLYMDWLERTDPNNLYPFLVVLPSGGILVVYWNEARILDEVTFATIKTLPNMPTAVNDDMGGRTYPLEGTAVLLPQYAPYGAPLQILICGGSTEGISNALDNCVTIEPDAADPEWVLERMPSPRVISCMSPLPDGTFLILNGAKHGVAGFGLAEDPNLNALLYDPTKAIGHRISVMSNTTVARMYHSEAITLLDGRVLVSGSDPEDGKNPQEYRVETFTPPYLKSGKPRPTFTMTNKDWNYGQSVTFTLGAAARNGGIKASLLGSVSSTHGNSMGARTLFPAVSCAGTTCTVTAPPSAHIAPPGWYQFFVLDGGIPGVGIYVRIGGDPAAIGNWPDGEGFTTPGI